MNNEKWEWLWFFIIADVNSDRRILFRVNYELYDEAAFINTGLI